MYSITHIKYEGPSTTPDRTYDIVCLTPDSDTNPSFLIRRWGKADTKGSAKIEMFDRASRAKVGLRAEERKRDDKFYHEIRRDEYQTDEGHEAYFLAQRVLPMLGKTHKIYEVLEDIKSTKHVIKDKTMADLLGKAKEAKKEGVEYKITPTRTFKDGEKYDNWGTW